MNVDEIKKHDDVIESYVESLSGDGETITKKGGIMSGKQRTGMTYRSVIETANEALNGMYDKKLHQSVLTEAESLINGDRAKSYGHPYHDYRRTVGAFNALTGHQLTVKEGIIFMMCVKLSRQMNCEKRDNLVDLAGYTGCLEKVIDKIEEDKLGGGQC